MTRRPAAIGDPAFGDRSFAGVFVACLPLTGLVIGAWIIWDLSIEQLSFLGLGTSLFVAAWVVRRYGIIGYHHSTGEEATIQKAPLPKLLAPALALAGIAFVLAGTPTGLGAALFGPARAAVLLYKFGEQTFGLLMAAFFLGAIVVCLFIGLFTLDAGLFFGSLFVGGFLFGLMALYLYAMYRFYPDQFGEVWDDYMEPFRFFVELIT